MSTVSAAASASNIQMDYMKLLITQMQNQNPLEPLNNDQMASQLAQFSQLSQLESINSSTEALNSSFTQALALADRNYATSLIGKEVTFYYDDPDGGAILKKVGTVKDVFNDSESGQSLLGVLVPDETGDGVDQDYTLSLDAVKLVSN